MQTILLFFALIMVFVAASGRASTDCKWLRGSPVAVPSRVEFGDAAGFSKKVCVGSAVCGTSDKAEWLYCGADEKGECPVEGKYSAKKCAEANYPFYDLSSIQVSLKTPVNNAGNNEITALRDCKKTTPQKFPVTVSERPGTDIYLGAEFCLMGNYCTATYRDKSEKEGVFVPVACKPDPADKCPETVEECFKAAPHTVNFELVKQQGKRLGVHNVSSSGSSSVGQTAGPVHIPVRR